MIRRIAPVFLLTLAAAVALGENLEPPATAPAATSPAPQAAMSDPTVPNEQLRAFLEQTMHKDRTTEVAGAKTLEITLQALVVNDHGQATAIIAIPGRGNVTVATGSIVSLTTDAQLKITKVSAEGVELLLPRVKVTLLIK